jgi:hypothetical protein
MTKNIAAEKKSVDGKLIRKIVTAILLAGFIITGYVDLLIHDQKTYSSIMAMNINRVYFYTFYLLAIGCWLLYNKWIVGIGFLVLAPFNAYFEELVFIHNYFASIAINIGIIIDILMKKKPKWFIPLVTAGLIQGVSFLSNTTIGFYIVGAMECLALCIGSVFVVKYME